MDVEVLRDALAWLQAGRRVALITVTGTWGSSPRPVGALLALRDDGTPSGSVSGGCVEDDLMARLAAAFPESPAVLRYGVNRDEALRHGLPCGGALELVVEPVRDPREEYAGAWSVAGARLLPGMPDDVVRALEPDARTVVVALTHDPKLDDLALLEALKSNAFYVGALGSRLTNARRRQRLAQFDLARHEIERLHGPVGLAIGSRTPPEIAVAVLAELTALRSGAAARAPSTAPVELSHACR